MTTDLEKTVSEQIEQVEKATKKRRKYTRRKKAAAKPPPATPKPSAEYAGIEPDKCPKACNAERCMISGSFYCAHPRKGGLQGVDMCNPEALARLHQADKILARRKLDSRHA